MFCRCSWPAKLKIFLVYGILVMIIIYYININTNINNGRDFQEYCLDLFEPSGHGRRRRRHVPGTGNGTALQQQTSAVDDRNATNFAKFKENIEYTVIMPEDIYHGAATASENNCGTFLALSGVLGCLLFVAAMILCYLTSRLQAAIGSKYRTAQQDAFGSGRLHTGTGQPSKFPVSFSSGSSAYSGRLH